jgi:alkanesulfonate monooxygenase SsuD/methylene tetrahydromethanopterin reductase-like flavin-dependent oxidoreductase (luciferase family)
VVQTPVRGIHPLRKDNPLKLGVFAMNMTGGAAMTTAEGTLEGTWDEQLYIARAADQAGFEFLLPVSRWRGLSGPSKFAQNILEVFTWAAGLAAITESICLLATSHVPIFHPLLAAKQGATIDQISNGRFGINVVVGWNADEFDMFDIAQLPHDERYDVGGEWVSIVKALWEEGRAEFAGKYYNVRDGVLGPTPDPQSQPVFVNAGQSQAGMRFAAEWMDFTFQMHSDPEVLGKMASEAHRIANEDYGREIGVLTAGYVVCADTEREAKAYARHYIEELGDFESADQLTKLMLAGDSRSMPPDFIKSMQRQLIAGWGGIPLVGTPEQIVQRLVDLHDMGFGGVGLTWVDYLNGIDQFNEQVLPLLVNAGLRRS